MHVRIAADLPTLAPVVPALHALITRNEQTVAELRAWAAALVA